MYRLAPLLLAGLLAACASAHQPTDTEAAAAEAANAANDAATCRSLGLQPDTPPYVRCVDRLADQRAQATQNSRENIARALKDQPPAWWR